MKWDRNCSFQKDRTEIAKIEKSSLEREDWGNGSDSSANILGIASDIFLFLFDGLLRCRASRHYQKQE